LKPKYDELAQGGDIENIFLEEGRRLAEKLLGGEKKGSGVRNGEECAKGC